MGHDVPPLRRHQLAHLSAAGWRRVLGHGWDEEARDCIQHWAERDLPLVVTRQPASQSSGKQPIVLGLSAPAAWSRRQLTIHASLSAIGWIDEFPLLGKVLCELPRSTRPVLRALRAALAEHRLGARVYGSVGWQHLSGLDYLHAASDLDLWIGVKSPEAADRAVTALQRHRAGGLRIDGELLLPDGSAVAWREWSAWRAGQCSAMLVKRLHTANIASTLDWGIEVEHRPRIRACAT